MEYYHLRSLAVSQNSRFLLVAGQTSNDPNGPSHPFISLFLKQKSEEYCLRATAVVTDMSSTFTYIQFMPKNQNNYIYMKVFDLEGNLAVFRTNLISFERVFLFEKFHDGRVNCLDYDQNMRFISCSEDCTIKSAILYPN